jgi:hypothetical protein
MANINSGIHKQLSTISLLIQLGIKSVRFYLRCELLDTESQVISILAKGSGDLPPPPPQGNFPTWLEFFRFHFTI